MMKPTVPRAIELLAPARNAEIGMEAIRHGADAVYIGASRFGARSAAGNSVADIGCLAAYAHLFGARVYVALNTILMDEELTDVETLAWELYRVGVDALIVQDMAFLKLSLPPIPLHASTQMDNVSPDKVERLAASGFSQVVLARELSLEQIAAIHRHTSVALEVFVHGALCVSFSGRCYASQYCFGRSANRGECAQFCRLAFDLVDRDDNVVLRQKHLLSLRDMNRSEALADLLQAGVSSFKIEGRLKDAAYVKNVTAYYRERLDRILAGSDRYVRASHGRSKFTFTPDPYKSFNRGFTDYFLYGRKSDVYSFHTPKAMGEPVGTVKEVRGNSFTVAGVAAFHNGDGLCFMDEDGMLQGFRVNRVENNRLFPAVMPRKLAPRMPLYRNYDHQFEQLLAHPSAERKLAVAICLRETPEGFALDWSDEAGRCITYAVDCAKEVARTPQRENWQKQLGKLGQTPFYLRSFTAETTEEWFIPSSVLAEWRRQGTDLLERDARLKHTSGFVARQGQLPSLSGQFTYLANISNAQARAFYLESGASSVDPAFELQQPDKAVLMFCKHCVRYSLGCCPVHQKGRSPFAEPYYLRLSDGRRFRLGFDCKNCQMLVYAPEHT
mgnify:FL=1